MGTICFIDKDGNIGTCAVENFDDCQIKEIMGQDLIIKCEKCPFYNKYKGEEKEYFIYTNWTGNLDDVK